MAQRGAPVRIGILGASSYAPTTLINPARGNDEVVVAAVGARDLSSAQAFAGKHGIARAHGSYEALIADPDLDAVYVLLPTSMYRRRRFALSSPLPTKAAAVRRVTTNDQRSRQWSNTQPTLYEPGILTDAPDVVCFPGLARLMASAAVPAVAK